VNLRNSKAWGVLATPLLAVAFVASGCQTSSLPYADNSVPASSNMWAPCPHGDAGRTKDVTLSFPDQWVCVK
jgi:hypothetical protein